MANSLTAEMVTEIRQRSIDQSLVISRALIESQLGVDDHNLSRGERVGRFIDFAQSGVLDVLKVIKPTLYNELVNQYQKDVAVLTKVE